MAQFHFDTNTVEKRENDYSLLPAGWYTAQVTESEIVPLAKTPGGSALKLTFEVLSDGYRNRKVWLRLNVRHPGSAQAEQISQQQLRELCDSIGIVRMTDTVELHNKPVQIKVKIRKDTTGQYEDQNDVTGFKSLAAGTQASMMPMPGGTFPTPQRPPVAAPSFPPFAHSAAPAAPAAEGGAATPPWAKRAA